MLELESGVREMLREVGLTCGGCGRRVSVGAVQVIGLREQVRPGAGEVGIGATLTTLCGPDCVRASEVLVGAALVRELPAAWWVNDVPDPRLAGAGRVLQEALAAAWAARVAAGLPRVPDGLVVTPAPAEGRAVVADASAGVVDHGAPGRGPGAGAVRWQAQAAAVVDVLAGAGLKTGEIAGWWQTPVVEFGGRTPREALVGGHAEAVVVFARGFALRRLARALVAEFDAWLAERCAASDGAAPSAAAQNDWWIDRLADGPLVDVWPDPDEDDGLTVDELLATGLHRIRGLAEPSTIVDEPSHPAPAPGTRYTTPDVDAAGASDVLASTAADALRAFDVWAARQQQPTGVLFEHLSTLLMRRHLGALVDAAEGPGATLRLLDLIRRLRVLAGITDGRAYPGEPSRAWLLAAGILARHEMWDRPTSSPQDRLRGLQQHVEAAGLTVGSMPPADDDSAALAHTKLELLLDRLRELAAEQPAAPGDTAAPVVPDGREDPAGAARLLRAQYDEWVDRRDAAGQHPAPATALRFLRERADALRLDVTLDLPPDHVDEADLVVHWIERLDAIADDDEPAAPRPAPDDATDRAAARSILADYHRWLDSCGVEPTPGARADWLVDAIGTAAPDDGRLLGRALEMLAAGVSAADQVAALLAMLHATSRVGAVEQRLAAQLILDQWDEWAAANTGPDRTDAVAFLRRRCLGAGLTLTVTADQDLDDWLTQLNELARAGEVDRRDEVRADIDARLLEVGMPRASIDAWWERQVLAGGGQPPRTAADALAAGDIDRVEQAAANAVRQFAASKAADRVADAYHDWLTSRPATPPAAHTGHTTDVETRIDKLAELLADESEYLAIGLEGADNPDPDDRLKQLLAEIDQEAAFYRAHAAYVGGAPRGAGDDVDAEEETAAEDALDAFERWLDGSTLSEVAQDGRAREAFAALRSELTTSGLLTLVTLLNGGSGEPMRVCEAVLDRLRTLASAARVRRVLHRYARAAGAGGDLEHAAARQRLDWLEQALADVGESRRWVLTSADVSWQDTLAEVTAALSAFADQARHADGERA